MLISAKVTVAAIPSYPGFLVLFFLPLVPFLFYAPQLWTFLKKHNSLPFVFSQWLYLSLTFGLSLHIYHLGNKGPLSKLKSHNFYYYDSNLHIWAWYHHWALISNFQIFSTYVLGVLLLHISVLRTSLTQRLIKITLYFLLMVFISLYIPI